MKLGMSSERGEGPIDPLLLGFDSNGNGDNPLGREAKLLANLNSIGWAERSFIAVIV
jgi:hypothetical protein